MTETLGLVLAHFTVPQAELTLLCPDCKGACKYEGTQCWTCQGTGVVPMCANLFDTCIGEAERALNIDGSHTPLCENCYQRLVKNV